MMRITGKAGGLLVAALALAGLLPRASQAYSYLETTYGTPLHGLSARALGMGGATTAVSDGSYSLVGNPAMMSGEDQRMVDLSLRGVRYDETRYVPLYDSFDAYVKDTAVAENPDSYSNLSGGLLYKPTGGLSHLALAAGIYERYNFDFDFVEERRWAQGTDTVRRDLLRATQIVRSTSSVYSASAGASYKEHVLSLGVGVHYYFGSIGFSNVTVPGPVASGANDGPLKDGLSRDLSGLGATFGMAADLSERVTVAAAYELPVDFDVDWRRNAMADTTIGTGNTRYPGILSLGLAFRPRNNPRTIFAVDAVRTFWEDLDDDILTDNPVFKSTSVRNTWAFHAGVEHLFYNNLPARFGFSYRESYAADEVDEAGLAMGTGYRMDNWNLGLGVDIMKRNSRQTAIGLRTGSDPKTDNVQDSLVRAVLDVRYRF